MNALIVDDQILLEQLDALGKIGADDIHGGCTRLALSDHEKQGRDQFVQWLKELDLAIHIDEIGNIFGILQGQTDEPPLMMGSHIDTVRQAGKLDGCYGVLAGLAVIRAYRRANITPHHSLIVAAFTNEEGVRYQPDMMGSLVYAGGLDVKDALDTIGIDGTRLGDELSRIGYAGSMQVGSLIPKAYLELHIEQGPILEATQHGIGAVENLQGISWQKLTITGVANHAGTTPTALRQDACYVAGKIISFLRDEVVGANPDTTLATVGSLTLTPNVINVIAKQAVMTVDIRDPNEHRLQQAEQKLNDYLTVIAKQESVTISTETLARFSPVVFDETLVQLIEHVAEQQGHRHQRMTSGAGHDAQMMARLCPTAMIFVPSHHGISHNPAEHTDDGDLIAGAKVLLGVIGQLDTLF